MNKRLQLFLPVFAFFLLSQTTPYIIFGDTQEIIITRIVIRSILLGMGLGWLLLFVLLKSKKII